MKEETKKIFAQLIKDGATKEKNLPNPIRYIENDRVIVYCLNKGVIKECIIDDADIKNISIGRVWVAMGRKDRANYYIGCNIKNNTITTIQHLILYGADTIRDCDKVIDYIDRDTLNNTKDNLRIVTKKEDMRNKGLYKNNSSGNKSITKKDGQYKLTVVRLFSNKDNALVALKEIESVLNKYF